MGLPELRRQEREEPAETKAGWNRTAGARACARIARLSSPSVALAFHLEAKAAWSIEQAFD